MGFTLLGIAVAVLIGIIYSMRELIQHLLYERAHSRIRVLRSKNNNSGTLNPGRMKPIALSMINWTESTTVMVMQ